MATTAAERVIVRIIENPGRVAICLTRRFEPEKAPIKLPRRTA